VKTTEKSTRVCDTLTSQHFARALTTGQPSPTSPTGHNSKTQPHGSAKDPIRPLFLSLTAGSSCIARTVAVNPRQAEVIVTEAIEHDGFGHVDFLTQCPTRNKDAKESVPYTDIQDSDDFEFDITDRTEASEMMDEAESILHERPVLTGRFYRDTNRLTYHKKAAYRRTSRETNRRSVLRRRSRLGPVVRTTGGAQVMSTHRCSAFGRSTGHCDTLAYVC
jgi:pyruvate/2-oxoacid:ferredoxin oxidoreductase beta subunit